MPGRAGPAGGWRALVARGVGAALPLLLLAPPSAAARAPKGPDAHRPESDCRLCHTADAATLRSDPARARELILPDLESRCFDCHAGEGPSHKTGVRPRGVVPPELPLSSDGRITCSTCHYVHGEANRANSFERIDNRRGKLCLTCHKLSELQ